jgi:hypothetical protein
MIIAAKLASSWNAGGDGSQYVAPSQIFGAEDFVANRLSDSKRFSFRIQSHGEARGAASIFQKMLDNIR